MGIVVLILVVLLFVFIFEYNIIKTLHKKVSQSRSGIDVALNKRFDLIPNLVECVKGYTKYEQEALNSLVSQRDEFYKNGSLAEASVLNNKCNQILALGEKYPALKTSEQFLNLQDALEKVENQLQAARRLYNSDVTMYNTKITTFPGNVFASFMKMKEEELFEIDDNVRQNIDIQNV